MLIELKNIIFSILVIIFCVFLFVGTYLLNKNTKKPEGCEDLEGKCAGCKITSCSHNPINEKKENE